MTTAVVGAGPVGMVCALGLAQVGEDVLLLDRDADPAAGRTWRRTGVMQFRHPHFFRHQVGQVLQEHVPRMWEAVAAAGCVVNAPPDGLPPWVRTVSARRATFEAALRSTLHHERITHLPRRADRVVVERDRVTGVEAGGSRYDVDRVVAATGRSGALANAWRPAAEGGPCGQSYVSRMYRARPGVEPLVSWNPLGGQYDGYVAMAFPQDGGTLSALVVRRSHDPGWEPLWRERCFDAVVARIPVLAPWTDPERFEPLTPVMRGGTLVNSYRGQGSPPAGLFAVGDAVCTTHPSAGRGVSLGLLQAGALLTLLSEHGDARDVSRALDAWCSEEVRPWFDDHLAVDAATVRARDPGGPDVDAPPTSDVVCAAAEVDPVLQEAVQLYQGMITKPASLVPFQPRVGELLRQGWRPRWDVGPSRDDLVELMAGVGGSPDPSR